MPFKSLKGRCVEEGVLLLQAAKRIELGITPGQEQGGVGSRFLLTPRRSFLKVRAGRKRSALPW